MAWEKAKQENQAVAQIYLKNNSFNTVLKGLVMFERFEEFSDSDGDNSVRFIP